MDGSCSTMDTWKKRYKLGDGNIDDMKTDLVNQINVGSRVAVLQEDSGKQRLYKPTIVYGGLTDERLYAQISNELGLNGNVFAPVAERLHRTFYIDNTLMVASQFDNISHISNTSYTWFTKTDLHHCFNKTSLGNRHSSADDCFTQIQNGGELYVKVGEKGGFASFERKTPEMNDFVFSLPFHPSLINSDQTSTTPPTWAIVVGSSASTRISILTAELSKGATTHNIVTSLEYIDFYVGPCWYQVYHKDVTGTDEGSYDSLLDAVLSGKRIRVKFDSHEKVLTVDMISILGNKLKANFKVLPHTASNDENILPFIRFYQIATDGNMSYCSVDLESDNIHDDHEIDVPTSSYWYVESRAWRLVLKVSDTGEVVAGSIDALKQAIQDGQGIRVQLTSNSVVYIVDVNVAELKSDGDVIFQSGPHLHAQVTTNCYVITFLIDNNFKVTTRQWSLVSDHVIDISSDFISFGITWFIDD
ncbi:uncharacterized protein LOC126817792 [Patella vulgata]|uniref:uncharacterized protein LOC126817792 n=1 Tax=Patella vulgata TaxID=6465 RepID=UPI0024A7F52D|nr:uncharacterized protein LOC126817792 [Patella vulgata]